MRATLKRIAIAGATLVALAILGWLGVYLASEALIVRRYTLPSSIVEASTRPAALERGARLATVFGCRDCHGADLTGRMMQAQPGLAIAAPSLVRFAARHSDADFDRAVRRGLTPSARAIWVMPSGAYVYMRDADLAAIIGYLRAQPVRGPVWPEPRFSMRARLAVLAGRLAPVDPYDLGRHPPLDAGPRYDGGRYLAAMACSGCHATDLTGTSAAPDLKVAARYSRTQFFALMRTGEVPRDHLAPRMARLARTRFNVLKDYEIDALYAYLVARVKVETPGGTH
jgi:cytochrome c553